MQIVRLIQCAVLSCFCLFGQGARGEVNINIFGPPELRVDILLRALDRGASGLSAKEEVKALQDAFDKAGRASQAFKRRALPETNVESRTNYLAAALENNIDTLSLRARILQRLKPEPAIKTLETSIPPIVPSLSCGQAWTWDVEAYYQALTTLANRGFSKREIAAGKRLDFVSLYALNLTSAAQIAPSAALIRQVTFEDAELQGIMATFVSRLSGLRDGPRAVSVGVVPGGFNQVLLLFEYCKSRNAFAIQLLAGYRTFLAANAAASICPDMQAKPAAMPAPVRQFNAFIEANPSLSIPPLHVEEVKPQAIEEKAWPELFETQINDGELFRQVRALRTQGDKLAGDEWKSGFRELVDQAQSSFDKGSLERTDIFNQQCVLLLALRSMARDQDERTMCYQALLRIVENSPVEESSPPEWLLHVLEFVRTGAVTNIKASKNAMLSAYVLLAAN